MSQVETVTKYKHNNSITLLDREILTLYVLVDFKWSAFCDDRTLFLNGLFRYLLLTMYVRMILNSFFYRRDQQEQEW